MSETDGIEVRKQEMRTMFDWRSFNTYVATQIGLNESIVWVEINSDLNRTPLEEWPCWIEGNFERLLRFYSFWTRAELIKAFRSLAKQKYLELGPITEDTIFYRPHSEVIAEAHEGKARPVNFERATIARVRNAGYVYLMTGGGYFKIGLSKDPPRRAKELLIALPYPVTIVHVIKTSDMVALENHWHSRFVSKRVGGEWFSLSPLDVADFCAVSEMEAPQ